MLCLYKDNIFIKLFFFYFSFIAESSKLTSMNNIEAALVVDVIKAPVITKCPKSKIQSSKSHYVFPKSLILLLNEYIFYFFCVVPSVIGVILVAFYNNQGTRHFAFCGAYKRPTALPLAICRCQVQ